MPAFAGMTVEFRAMHTYGVKDVEKLLRLPRSTIRALIAAGFVAPTRGPRNRWLFSFQDLIVLRTAQALAEAKLSAKRINSSLKELRRQLPQTMPLSGLSISAAGNHVAIRDATGRRQVESGQYLLAFEGNPETGALKVVEAVGAASAATVAAKAAPTEGGSPTDWFERGLELEVADREGAIKAYERAVAVEPERVDAHINLGRLLHEAGRLAQAEHAYRNGIRACGEDPVLLFNLGVLLEDRKRDADAVKAYEAALRGDPGLADCHYNLSLLYQKLRQPKDALRHMSQYKRLMSSIPR
jgi:tetratricopeptide (TPR) repeat protein